MLHPSDSGRQRENVQNECGSIPETSQHSASGIGACLRAAGGEGKVADHEGGEGDRRGAEEETDRGGSQGDRQEGQGTGGDGEEADRGGGVQSEDAGRGKKNEDS